MKHTKIKMLLCLLLAITMCLPIVFLVGCNKDEGGNEETSTAAKVNEFYETVVESQSRMDTIADNIYRNWYDAIYNDKFACNVDLAIAYALSDNKANFDFIKENEKKIQSLYKGIRDSEVSNEIKDVLYAYSDYYEFVINVNGSLESYSANKEKYKTELSNSLKHLSMVL